MPATSILLQDETYKGLVVIEARGNFEKRFRFSETSDSPCWVNLVSRFGSKLLFSIRYPASKNKFIATEMDILSLNYCKISCITDWAYFGHLLHAVPVRNALCEIILTFFLAKNFNFTCFLWGICLQSTLNLLKYAFFIHASRIHFLKETPTDIFVSFILPLKYGVILTEILIFKMS